LTAAALFCAFFAQTAGSCFAVDWSINLVSGNDSASVYPVDLDGSGGAELIITSGTSVLAYNGDGSNFSGYPLDFPDDDMVMLFNIREKVNGAGAYELTDIDGDGSRELAILHGNESSLSMSAYSPNGGGAAKWDLPIPGQPYTGLIANIDGDPQQEMVFGVLDDSQDRHIICWDGATRTVQWDINIGAGPTDGDNNLSAIDITGDGIPEIAYEDGESIKFVSGSDGHFIGAINRPAGWGLTQFIQPRNDSNKDNNGETASFDIDHDGSKEVALFFSTYTQTGQNLAYKGAIYMYSGSLQYKWNSSTMSVYAQNTTDDAPIKVYVNNVDSDPQFEFIVNSRSFQSSDQSWKNSTVSVIDGNNHATQWSYNFGDNWSDVNLVDINNDGVMDLAVSHDNKLGFYNGLGTLLWEISPSIPSGMWGGIYGVDSIASNKVSENRWVLPDIDNDGARELAVVVNTSSGAGNNFYIYQYNAGTHAEKDGRRSFITSIPDAANGLNMSLSFADVTGDSVPETILQESQWNNNTGENENGLLKVFSGPPYPPGDFSCADLSSSTIQWSWQDTAEETGYRVFDQDNIQKQDLSADTTFWIETGLAKNTSYTRYARAFNAYGQADSAQAVCGTFTNKVYVSTADVSPAYFMTGEEAAALSITPYTDSGDALFSGLTVRLDAGGNSCSLQAISLYYDTDHNNVWSSGDRLVSSSTLDCSASYTFNFASETVDTQKIAYFIAVTPSGGDNISVEIPSASSFQFGANMADQFIYPITSAPKKSGKGANDFKMISDGAGGAYMVYDSTVAAGGLRKAFVKRVDAHNSAVWGPVEVSPGYYSGENGNEIFAGSDGAGGVIAAWFGGGGVAYAQRYDVFGVRQWTDGGVQISSGAADGGMFRENAEGGFFALFGYASGSGMGLAVQKVNNTGQCMWPNNIAGNCVDSSVGIVIPSDFSGDFEPSVIDGGSGSLWFVWGGNKGGKLELYGSKVSAEGTLAWNEKTLSATGGDEGRRVKGIGDGSGGVYLVWTSSRSDAPGLYANRFNAAGDAYTGWASPLRLSDAGYADDYRIYLAKDEDGFAVLYSPKSDNGSDMEMRIVRSSASAGEFAPGWALNGKLAGNGSLDDNDSSSLIYDGSAYHFVWSESGWPYSTLYYQKMTRDGAFSFAGGYAAGNFQNNAVIAVSTDGAGGALAGWKQYIGGGDVPGLKAIPSGAGGPVTVFLSTADVSPASFMTGEEAAALRITPYTNSGYASFSGLTVRLDAGGNSCSLQAVSLYYDTDHNNAWSAGDRLVSSSTLNCAASYTFNFSSETVDTQKIAYFIAVTSNGGDMISLEIPSAASFKFGAAVADQSIYPITSVAKRSGKGSNEFRMISDGAGGAYMVYDSTVAAGGLRKVFVKRVDAHNAAVWGPVEVSPGYYSVEAGSDFFAGSDGALGVIAAWFDGSGVAYAQRYNQSGVPQWTDGGVQISSGAAQGGMFRENEEGGFFALFGYASGGIVVQKVNNSGQCLWPSNTAGNCVYASVGTVIPSDFNGDGDPGVIDGGSGSLWFMCGEKKDGKLELRGSKVSADGKLAWNEKTLSATGGDEGRRVKGVSDGAGGTYIVWTSARPEAPGLYAKRFDADGNAYTDWPSPLRLSDVGYADDYRIYLAKDEDGFAVLYSTKSDNGSGVEMRIVRSSAAAGEFAPGWALNGKLAGNGSLGDNDSSSLIYDGSAYHFVWSEWGWPYSTLYYQKMTRDGAFSFAGGYAAGNFQNDAIIAVSTDGAGGALAGWKQYIGGGDVPGLKAIPSGAGGPVTVFLSTADMSPATFMTGEEAAALRITPYTDSWETLFSGLTVRLDAGGNSCSLQAVSLYYDADHNNSWSAGDRLVSSSTLDCAASYTFNFSSETVDTQKIAYFIVVTPNGGDKISLEITSAASFKFGAAVADQSIYPITSALKRSGKGSNDFKMISDGAGGAYMVYDSTVAAGGLRKVFVKRVDAHNSAVWGPVEVSPGYYSGEVNSDIFAESDGEKGVIAAWLGGSGVAYAQRYNQSGVPLWTTGGVQISSGAADGAMFKENAEGGFFALFGYASGGIAVQKVNNSGRCLWPNNQADNCVDASVGTIIPSDFSGDFEASLIDGGSGSLWFVWGGNKDSKLELYGSKVSADGQLAWNKKTLSATGGDEGRRVKGIGDASGGAYIVWISAKPGASGLYANRFNADGNAYTGWASPLRLSDVGYADDYRIYLAKDEDGFAVLYSTISYNSSVSQMRIVRLSAAAGEFASGWALNGKLAGNGSLQGNDSSSLIYDGSAYHFVWSGLGWPYSTVYYQKMTRNGAFSYADGYAAGNYQNEGIIAVSTDGAGGALAGWKQTIGGGDVPGLKAIPLGTRNPGTGFTGDFSQEGGASFDGGDMDYGTGAAFYNSNIYVVGTSASAGVSRGIIIKYDQAGNAVSSAAFSGADGFTSVKANANGVYATAQGENKGFVTAKYTLNLVFVSSAVLPGDSSAKDMALDAAGNVYVIGANWGEQENPALPNYRDYKLVKYGANLAQIGSPVLFNAGGIDKGRGIAVDNGNVYITGDSLIGATTYFVTAKYNSSSMAFISSVSYAGGYVFADFPMGEKLTVNANTHEVYFAGTYGTTEGGDYKSILTVRYSQNLVQLSTAVFSIGAGEDQGADITLDSSGNVYTLGINQAHDGVDYAALLKYNSALVFLSSATREFADGYVPTGIAMDNATGESYATGMDFGTLDGDISMANMRTVRFEPLGNGGHVPPAAPTAFGGTALGTSSITWRWTDNANNETGYKVLSSTGGIIATLLTGTPTNLGGVSWTESGLAPNTWYYRYAQVFNDFGESSVSTQVYTLADAAGAPEIVSAASYSFYVKWGPGGNPDGTRYELNSSTDAFLSGSFSSTTVNGYSGSGGYVEAAIADLSPATTYYIRVRAVNGDSIPSAYSASVSSRTFAAPPQPPSGLAAAYDPDSRKTSISWSPAASGVPAASFRVYWSQEPNPDYFYILGSTESRYLEQDNPPSTTYYYSISALNSDGVEGARSERFQIVPPAAPTAFAGAALGTSSITWSWNGNADNETGYRVLDSTQGLIVTLPPGATSWTEISLAPNTLNSRYVLAYNAQGASSLYSAYAKIYTLADAAGAPEIVSVSPYSLNIKWNLGGNPAGTLYELNRSTDDFQSGSSSSTTVDGDHEWAGYLATIPDLSPATTYYIRVRAVNGDSIPSAYSASVSTRTFAAPPQPPSSLAAAYDPASKKVSIFWSPAFTGVPSASFNVYRAAEPYPDSFSSLGSTENRYFEDAGLHSTTYYYTISALNSDGVEGARSEPLQAVVDVDPPAIIADLKLSSYSAAGNSAALSWTGPYDNTALGHYLIKAGTYAIGESEWNDSVIVGTAAASASAGAVQTYVVPVSSTETLKFFAVKTFDAAGNASQVSNPAVLDLVPPSVAVTSPLQPDIPVTRPFSMHIEASDNYLVGKLDFLVDNVVVDSVAVQGQAYSSDHIWNTVDYSDGNHVFSVNTYDQYGNADEKQFPVFINYAPPAAPVISQPVNNFAVVESTIVVYGSAEPGTNISIFVNGMFVTSVEANAGGGFYAAVVPLGGDGAVSIAAQAVDARGAGPRSAAVSGVVDSGPPGAPVSLAAQSSAYGKVTLSWSAPEGEVPASYNIYRSASETDLTEGGAPSGTLLAANGITAREFTDTPSPDGVYSYAVVSVDAAGNLSVLSNVVAAVSDSLAPSAAITLPGSTPPLGAGSYHLEVAVSEALSENPYLVFTAPGGNPVQVVLESSSPYIWIGTFTVTQAMASGAGYFTFQGLDLTGNTGSEITEGSTVELQTEGPVADISFDPQAGPALKAGSYALRLVLSHSAVSVPELYFSSAAGSRPVYLSSTTSASDWRGIITVDAATGEGLHNFSYSAPDSLGNTGTLMQGATYFIADTYATGAPAALHWANGVAGLINLSWSAPLGEKPARYCVYRDSSQLNCSVTPKADDFSGVFSETPSEGVHDYYVTALDQAANESAASIVVHANSDDTPPVSPHLLSAAAESSSVALTWAAGDGETPASFRLYRATYTITSTAGQVYRALAGSSASDSPARDGVYHYAMTALDQAGNESALSNEITVSYDAAAPDITISGVEDGKYYNGEVRPSFEAFDLNLAASSALLNNSPFASGSAVSAPGNYALVVSASDTLSHAASKTVNFTIDKTSPTITLSGIADDGVYTAAVTPVISASDAHLSTITALLNGSPYISGTTITESGSYTLEVTATDLAGNTAAYSAAFTMDLPPQKVGSLAAVIEDGSALALTWASYPGDVAGYKVFKDSMNLGSVAASRTSLRDTAYSPASAHIYEVVAVDSKGREGARARAEIPFISFALAGYGNYSGSEQALNRGFFDTVRFTATNNGAQTIQAGPVSLAVGSDAPLSVQSVNDPAGSSIEIVPVVYTSTSSAASVSARAELALPQGGDAAVSAVTTFTMAVRDPLEPIVEIYPEALLRGAYSKVSVKFNNRGSAPADIVTARVSAYSAQPSPAVAVSLKTKTGFILSTGEVLQSTHDVSAAYIDGGQSYFARVEPGSSYVFDPIALAVPDSAETELTITGGVYAMSHSLGYEPVSVSPVFEASRSQSAVAAIPYTAVVAPSKQIYDKGEPVVFTGTVRDSISGYLLGNKAVLITVLNKGFERSISTVTASDGFFTSVFTPATGEAGIYYISASYPYAVDRLAQSSFTVVGFELGYTDYKATLAQNSSYTFEVPLINSGETAVGGLSATFEEVFGSGVTMTVVSAPVELEAGTKKSLSVMVSAAADASSTAGFTLKLRDSNGFERTMPVNISVVPAQVIPKLTPQAFEMGMLAGETRTQSITVENIGFSTWTGVTVGEPTLSWVKLQGPQELGDIPPGGNVTLTLLIQPPVGLSNGSYAQNPLVVLKSQGYGDVPVNAGLVITSVKQGNAAFTVMNADKAPTDPMRWIGGADVTLTSLDIIGMSLKVKSDSNGLARFENVPSGRYAYRAEASGFQTVSGMASMEPGLTRTMDVLMPTSMVTYKWSVTPTTITDKYDITLDMTFRTDVPAPVIIADPTNIHLIMAGGQTILTQFTVKNKGLISAFNVKLQDEITDPAVKMEYAFNEIAELKAGQTVVVPVKITLEHASCHLVSISIEYDYLCLFGIYFHVGPDSNRRVSFTIGDGCGTGGTGGGSGGGGGGGWSGGGGGGGSVYLPVAGAVVKTCSGKTPNGPSYPNGGPNSCSGVNPATGNNNEPGPYIGNSPNSLAADYWAVYNSLKGGFSDPTVESLVEQPDGNFVLTQEDGTKILFVSKGAINPEVTGGDEQFEHIPALHSVLLIGSGQSSLTDKDGTVTEFADVNGVWKPKVIRDRNNTTLTYDYNAGSKLAKITDIHGRVMNFGYNADGKLNTVGDTQGRQLSYNYDSSGRLVKAVDIDGAETSYGYDTAGFLSLVTYPNGAHKYIVSDAGGRALSVAEDNDNNKQTFEYVDASSKTIMTDALSRHTAYEYINVEGRKEITKITDALGNVTSYGYDEDLNKISVTDALSRATRMTYDGKGNMLSATDPAGNYTGMTYESTYNRPVTVTDPKGAATEMSYDASGNLIKVKDAYNNISEIAYDIQGHVTGTKDPQGHISNFDYDTMGALIKVTDPLGRITQMTRDNLSRVTRTVDPKNKLTLFDYDIKGNLTYVKDALNGETHYTYTGGGCPSCGGAGDLLGSVMDAKNQQTSFTYDLQKRLTAVKNPLNQAKSFVYDKKGNLTSVTDAKGVTITFEYDFMDRLTVKHLPEGDVTYTYDLVGNLLSVTSPDGALSMTYDAVNRVVSTTQRFPIYSSPFALSYAYDANGNRTQMTSPWGATSYTYDALNRLTSLTNPDAKTVTFAYDALGRRTKMTYPNGTETTYAYDAGSQLTQILHWKTADNTAIAFANYTYDPAGNRISMQDLAGYHSYAYDDLHRLISADHPAQSAVEIKNETFSYDAVGNRTADAVITGYQHNAANRLLENSSYTYTYDANGNLTGQTEKANNAHTTYAYNSENQLVSATMPDGAIAAYKYDPLGRRVEKTLVTSDLQHVTDHYVYDNEDIIAILDMGNNIQQTFTHGPGIDEPLIMKKADGTNYYYHADGLGSITALSDNTGAIVETIEYQAYGKPVFKDASGTVIAKPALGNPYTYTSREYDDETGLLYYRARYHSIETGRFIQEDPIGFAGGNVNLYAYLTNNPINRTDPLGLWVIYGNWGGPDWTGGQTIPYEFLTEEQKGKLLAPKDALDAIFKLHDLEFSSARVKRCKDLGRKDLTDVQKEAIEKQYTRTVKEINWLIVKRLWNLPEGWTLLTANPDLALTVRNEAMVLFLLGRTAGR